MMRSLSSVAVLAGLATTVAGLTAPLNAQEFRIEEASSVAGLAVEQLKATS